MQDLPGPGTEPVSLTLQGRFLTTGPPEKPLYLCILNPPLPHLPCGSAQPCISSHLDSCGSLWIKAQTPQPDTWVTALPPVAFTPQTCVPHPCWTHFCPWCIPRRLLAIQGPGKRWDPCPLCLLHCPPLNLAALKSFESNSLPRILPRKFLLSSGPILFLY